MVVLSRRKFDSHEYLSFIWTSCSLSLSLVLFHPCLGLGCSCQFLSSGRPHEPSPIPILALIVVVFLLSLFIVMRHRLHNPLSFSHTPTHKTHTLNRGRFLHPDLPLLSWPILNPNVGKSCAQKATTTGDGHVCVRTPMTVVVVHCCILLS